MTPVVDVTDRRCTRICWWSCHLQASSWPKSFPSIQPTWTSTTCSPWTPSCTSECVCVRVCVCVPVLHQHGQPPPAVHGPHHVQVSVSICVCACVCVCPSTPLTRTSSYTSECVCVCVPVLHQPGHPPSPVHGLHHVQVNVCVCVSQYSTSLDIHHLLSMDFHHVQVNVCASVCVCPSTPPAWTSTISCPWTSSCTSECVCVCVPVLLQPGHPPSPVHGLHHVQVNVCVCVSQYSTNLDIHHLQSMAPSCTCESLCVYVCPSTPPT